MADEGGNTKPCVKCGASDRYANGRCRPCQRTYIAAWRAANPDRVARWKHVLLSPKRAADWRAANPERNREAQAKWEKANPESRRIREHNRRARKREAGGTLSKGLADKLFKLQRGKCACCHVSIDDGNHLDHVIPVALGGPNEDWNMQLLCAPCNLSKNAKHPIEFMQSRGFLL